MSKKLEVVEFFPNPDVANRLCIIFIGHSGRLAAFKHKRDKRQQESFPVSWLDFAQCGFLVRNACASITRGYLGANYPTYEFEHPTYVVSRRPDGLSQTKPICYHFVEVKPVSNNFITDHLDDLIFDFQDDCHPRAVAVLQEISQFKKVLRTKAA